ncbi:N-acetylglucosamine kinase [Photobacterium leiognathi]|uniref:N-acetylglucosamine kinase n=1 Tax=Photobacterium leiognathi TaxID=553611 RepID=UPI0002088A73|nr:N-acetylglucosamine kinase [Photobacterium leiognathi]PSV00168.1 N-acetylglucosamine kinase [Photobacterium leiognathi subsp. mandapamensis]PSW52369.1 N-acetylglucosamine kinase [Photobacterium leiognathi subsp. mandapamensis]GAA05607.1 badF/BadG/BcrA/BcrD ATPase family protein [Photobacterium leiognathi subsp. mandapamensis svers.1.1.]
MANIRFLVGVDGGGTSCRARICDINGNTLGEAKTGSANILLGSSVAMASINDAIATAAEQAGLNSSHFRHMSVGLALAGAEQQDAWYAFMKQPHPYGAITLNTDAYGACLGAWGGKDGAILIAGTGSCGILLKEGQQHVVGGREFPISDQGGGAVMGLRLIQQVLLSVDGIVEQTPLARSVLEYFNHDVDSIVSWSKTARPCDYGQFSPSIFAHAAQGDKLAVEMLLQTAADIEMWMNALIQRGADKICLMGSIAERIHAWLIPPLQQRIATPQGDAMDGAIAMARSNHNLYQL